MNWIAANEVDKSVGSLTYTQMLDGHGGIQTDVTIVRLAENEFYIVTGTGFATHDFDWIARNITMKANAQLFDVTSATCVLSLMGPNARSILSQVTRSDVSNESFPFATSQIIGIAGIVLLDGSTPVSVSATVHIAIEQRSQNQVYLPSTLNKGSSAVAVMDDTISEGV